MKCLICCRDFKDSELTRGGDLYVHGLCIDCFDIGHGSDFRSEVDGEIIDDTEQIISIKLDSINKDRQMKSKLSLSEIKIYYKSLKLIQKRSA